MKEFFCFLLSPYDKPMVDGWRNKVRFTFISLGVLIVLLLAIAALRMLYIHFTNDYSNSMTDLYIKGNLNFMIAKYGTAGLLVLGCLIGPLLEEAAFRLSFSFKRRHVLTGLPILALMISLFFGKGYLYIGGGALIASLILLACKSIRQEQLDGVKQRYGILLLHVMALFFALLHIANYGDFDITRLGSYIFSIGSILTGAYIFYYVRIRAGFIYGLALHVTLNSYMLIRFINN
ncbi:hypothetical protein [uncultured Acetobacteroides sp.]|uniref:hypothetical protein n=1 Tax=uncultured Acetobacteroides sp. TaxID=1760811 RepID=UPI0029F56EFF|nr:hypothetical protein [uncultured Acetobacteroides sp.]